jgi:hypothetical protein
MKHKRITKTWCHKLKEFYMAKKCFLKLSVMAVIVALAFSSMGCSTQYNNLLQPTTTASSGIENYTVLGAVSIVAVGVGALSTPLQYKDLLQKAQSTYGADKVSKVINVQINSYEDKLFGFISISRKTEMAGIAVK